VSTIAVASSSLLFGHGSGYGFSHAPFLGFPQRGIGRHTLGALVDREHGAGKGGIDAI
jgi:hypothetical protein